MKARCAMTAAWVVLALGAAAVLAQGGGDDRATLLKQLAEQRQEKARLEKKVEKCEEDVIYWQGEVQANPKSLTAPIGLRSAKQALASYQAQLKIAALRVTRLERKVKLQQ